VLMLNGGTYVGVSRKIEDSSERSRLREIAGRLRPEGKSLIVRTEAEGRSEEELQQDLVFLSDMARRIEEKAERSSAPSLVHGDLALIFRLIRDAFTREVSRVVVDSPTAYENVLELVDLIAPRMRNRVFLYDDPMPIFHAYNVEAEIERALRRKVWLPSGGHLVIDQAEALTAIDVNTGRFVGSVDLAETVLTTNLQACEEVARQLRLRDLGGIIVVDFIDMDNARHRSQVSKAFEEALHRDRAKIKVHNISPLGLVEMTRKRTGESLAGLLTEPCPYCAGIGRVQNSLTMALRVEREIAASAVEYGKTEAFFVHAHPRVIGAMLGYEGEAHRDLEAFVQRPAYLRLEENYHPNAYRVEHLTLEQALVAVPHLEEGEVVEAVVANPDPTVSLDPLVIVKGIFLMVPGLDSPVGSHVKVRVTKLDTSFGIAEPLAGALRSGAPAISGEPQPLVPESALPAYLREERLQRPPQGMPLYSPSAHAVPVADEIPEYVAPGEKPAAKGRKAATEPTAKKGRGRRKPGAVEPTPELDMPPVAPEVTADTVAPVAPVAPEVLPTLTANEPPAVAEGSEPSELRSRRRRRRRGRGGRDGEAATGTTATPADEAEALVLADDSVTATPAAEGVTEGEDGQNSRRKRRHRGGRRHRRSGAGQGALNMEANTAEPEGATNAPPVPLETPAAVAQPEPILALDVPVVEEEKPAKKPRAPRPSRARKPKATAEAVVTEVPAELPVVETAPVSAPAPEVVGERAEEAPKPVRKRRVSTRKRALPTEGDEQPAG
jgi:ribonuclease G